MPRQVTAAQVTPEQPLLPRIRVAGTPLEPVMQNEPRYVQGQEEPEQPLLPREPVSVEARQTVGLPGF